MFHILVEGKWQKYTDLGVKTILNSNPPVIHLSCNSLSETGNNDLQAFRLVKMKPK